ncbi:MAG: cyanoexosortase A system-associated protein [Sphaerospermopsis sp. SIO1G1]|nr:cyanoexosortase A system-associated protein [Sphaerospermopsis sp. SIO1G1]
MFINTQKIIKAKAIFFSKLQLALKTQHFYLLGIFSTLAVLHLNIINSHNLESDNLTFYVLYWGGILYLLWKNPPRDKNITYVSSFLGLGILFITLFRPINLWYLDLQLFRVAPIFASLGLGLLAFGFSGLKHHWRLFLLLLLMLFPYGFIHGIFDFKLKFPQLTATISAFLLHYIGLGATNSGAFVILPTGKVEVLYYCTGGLLILWLMQLTLLILVVIHPTTWQQKLGLVLSAFGTGFITGCLRVSLLAVVVNNKSLFDYWHGKEGGTIFMVIATFTFAALCNYILPTDTFSKPQKIDEYSDNLKFIEPKRRLFLIFTWSGILLTAFFLFLNKKPVGNNIFNPEISVDNWQKMKVTSLKNQKIEIPDNGNYISINSGKDYIYLQNDQKLELQMRYVVNTRGNINPFLLSLSQDLKQDAENNIKYIENVGYYLLYSDAQKAYLTACINSRGGSTVNSSQFMNNRYKHDININRLIPWILGREVFRDDRCIWTQLSLPVNQKAATETYPILEFILKDNYKKWQTRLGHNY